MKYVAALLAVALLLSVLFRPAPVLKSDPQVEIWKAKYAEAVLEGQRVADTVVKRETVVRTKRDTVLNNLTDTLLVKEFVYQTDTLREACLQCVEQLREQARASQTLISALEASNVGLRKRLSRQKLTSRFGLFVGYGAMRVNDGSVRAGVQVGLGVRVFP